MFRTLDRYVIRSFLYTVLLCLFVLLMLRFLADLLANMDEWTKKDVGFTPFLLLLATHYGYNMLAYLLELGGLAIVASAAFTLAHMNHTNELVAMLASGVSLHRVVWPIVICAILMGGLLVVNQELIISRPDIQKRVGQHINDVEVESLDTGKDARSFQVRLLVDSRHTCWYAHRYTPSADRMDSPLLILRDPRLRTVASVAGAAAVPGELDGERGWFVDEGMIAMVDPSGRPWRVYPTWRRVHTSGSALELILRSGQDARGEVPFNRIRYRDETRRMRIEAERFEPAPVGSGERTGLLVKPRFIFERENGDTLVQFTAAHAVWRRDEEGNGYWDLVNGRLFVPSDLTGDELVLRQAGQWMDFLSSSQIARLLELGRIPDRDAAVMLRHIRVTDPISNLLMLLLGIPFILSRERNIKASATLCLLMVGAYYAFTYICRYVGLPPVWAAWLPILLFGPVAVVMLDSIKT